jgi:hypothetical protein
MARARFRHIKTGELFEANFDGTVYFEAIDDSGKIFKVNCTETETDAEFIEHLPQEEITVKHKRR